MSWPFPDATEQRRLLTTGQISPSELVEVAIERAVATGGLNAIIHPRYDQAQEQATLVEDLAAPLAGIPIAIKDLGCAQEGLPHHHGAQFLRDLQWTETTDSYLWSLLRDSGAISLGRTNTPEFGSTITTEPLAYGPTTNPWDPTRSPGGSSGGSAAVVAAGVVAIAHGNDGGGSIRIPASACGLVGLKPSRGRVSVGPEAGEHRGGLAVDGILTRTVRDTALGLDVIARPWPGDPYWAPPGSEPFVDAARRVPRPLRIAVSTGRAEPACVDATLRAAGLLEDLGHHIDTGEPTDWYDDEVTDQTIVLRTVAMATELNSWQRQIGRPLTEDDVEDSNWWSAELGRTLPGSMYVQAQIWLQQWTRRVTSFWNDHDILLTPVLGAVTPPIGFLSDPLEGQQRLRSLIGFVDQANVSGQPAISVPIATDPDDMPIGIQLVGAYAREDLLIQVAAQLEHSAPWASRRPMISG